MSPAPPPVTAIGFAGVPPKFKAPELEIVIAPPLALERMVPLFVSAAVVIVTFCAAIKEEVLSILTALAERTAAPLIVGANVLNVKVPPLARRVVLGDVKVPEPNSVKSVVPVRATDVVPDMVPALLILGAVIFKVPSLVIEPVD
jgi:hypothetical protein